MTRTRLVLIALVLLSVLFLVARESGSIRLNLHASRVTGSQSAHFTTTHQGERQPLSHDIELTHDGKKWIEHRRVILGAPHTSIRGELKDVTYEGNDWAPLRKSFTMTYVCEYATSPEEDAPATIRGTIQGKVSAQITGFCSHHEARRIALEKAKQQIREYVLKMNL